MKKLKQLLTKARDIFPCTLPRTKEEFDTFFSSIFETYNFPDKDEYKHAIATMVMHLDPIKTMKPKTYFVKAIQKAQANQVAYAIIQEINKKQKEEAELKKQNETPNGDSPVKLVQN